MMAHRSVLLVCLLLFVAAIVIGQNKKAERFVQKAEEALSQRLLSEAKSYYLKAIEADPSWADPYQELGILAFQNRDDSSSIYYLEQAVDKSDSYDPRVNHMLGELYMRNGKYENAHMHWTAFLNAGTSYEQLNTEARQKKEASSEILRMMEDPVATDLRPLPDAINTSAHEYLPLMPADRSFLIFTKRYKRPGERITREDYFISHKREGSWTIAEPIDNINTDEPEGGATLSADGKTLFMVRCHEREGMGSCDLYISFFNNGAWSKPVNLGPNVNTSHKERQPSLSPDGNRLYFSSNRPGGHGGMDIWYMDWLPEGKWSEAVNMDSCINSPHHERAPFIHYDNQTLYFTSDRPESLGESDIFMSRKQGEQWKNAVPLGWPVNTPAEEGTIYVSIDGKTAYMGRINKNTDQGYDIYSFTMKEEIAAIPSTYIQGIVVDAENDQPLTATLEILEKSSGNQITKLTSEKNGSFLIAIPRDKEYQFFAEAEGYQYYSRQFNYDDFEETEEGLFVKIKLQPIQKVAEGEEEPVTLENIYFETGSARLKPSSKPELRHLHQLLQENPEMNIELRGHTDDVGSAQANQNLSMQRAKAVYDYLIEKGIDESRLRYKGYGESKPIVPNTGPENRQQNRRTEFIIIE